MFSPCIRRIALIYSWVQSKIEMDFIYTLCDWIYIPAILSSLIASFLHKIKKNLLPIQIYVVISLIVNIILKISDLVPKNSISKMINYTVLNIYSIFEISLLYFFIYQILTRRKLKVSLLILFTLYSVIYISILFLYQKSFIFSQGPPFALENLLITIACFFVIYEFMNSNAVLNFESNANFIIICGILFYYSITIPFYFSYSLLEKISPEFFKIFSILNYVFYALLFFSFTKAFLCQLPEQKY